MGDPARNQDASVYRPATVAYTPLLGVGWYQPVSPTEANPTLPGPLHAAPVAAQPPIASAIGKEATQPALHGPGTQPSPGYLAPAQQVRTQAVAAGRGGEPYTPTKSQGQDATAQRQPAATQHYLPFRQGESQRGTPSDGPTASVGTSAPQHGVPHTQPQLLPAGGSKKQPQQHVQPPASSSMAAPTGIAGASAYLPPFFFHPQSATTSTAPAPGLQPSPSTVAATVTKTTTTAAAAVGEKQEATTPEAGRAPSSASRGAPTPASLRNRTTPPSTVSVPSYNPMAQTTASNPSSRGVSIDGTPQPSPLQQLQQHHPIYAMQLSSGTPATTPVTQPLQPSPREPPTAGQASQQHERVAISSLPIRSSSTPSMAVPASSSNAAAIPPYLPQSNAVLVSIATSTPQTSGTPQTSIPAQPAIGFGRTGPLGVAPRPVQIRGPAPVPVIVNRPYAVMPTDAVPGVPAAAQHRDTELQYTGAAALEDGLAGLRLEDYGGVGSVADWPQDYQQQEQQQQQQGQDRQPGGSEGPVPPGELAAKAQMLHDLVRSGLVPCIVWWLRLSFATSSPGRCYATLRACTFGSNVPACSRLNSSPCVFIADAPLRLVRRLAASLTWACAWTCCGRWAETWSAPQGSCWTSTVQRGPAGRQQEQLRRAQGPPPPPRGGMPARAGLTPCSGGGSPA